MPTDDPALYQPSDEQLQAAEYAAWREQVASRLSDAGRWSESVNFRDCGQLFGNFNVLVCGDDVAHEARALPFTCHLRYCPDCEHRQQAKMVAKYTPILKDLAESDSQPGWSLKKIVLTTPYPLVADNADELYQDGWEAFERWQQLMLQHLLKRDLTPGEIRRGRVDYKQHGYGSMVSAEFGGDGRKLHFHLTAYMPWLDKRKSSELWLEASGGEAEITWISKIDYHNVEDAIKEQVKYVTKFQELPPALVVKLADVLDGSRRVRTYGVVRGAPKLEPEQHKCSICGSPITIIHVKEYFEQCIARNIEPDTVIAAAGAKFLLDLKPGNKAGENGLHLARSDPDEPPKQANLPFLDAIAPKKKPFQYH